jgi:hypothetical protein
MLWALCYFKPVNSPENREPQEESATILQWLIFLYLAGMGANFFAFIISSGRHGGDALNGYSEAGHYFVCAHGSCTEVTAEAFVYSWWHGVSVIASFAIFFVVFFSAVAFSKFRKDPR